MLTVLHLSPSAVEGQEAAAGFDVRSSGAPMHQVRAPSHLIFSPNLFEYATAAGRHPPTVTPRGQPVPGIWWSRLLS